MYCEKTENSYQLVGIDAETLADLASLLAGVTHSRLNKVRNAIEQATGQPNDRIFSEQTRKIIPCEKCRQTGKLRVGNEREMHSNDLNTCHVCKGDGSRVQITSVRYESVNEHWKNILAPHEGHGFP